MSTTLEAPAPPPTPGPLTIPSMIPTSTLSDPPTFRSHFTEFADTTLYPDSAVQMFLDLGAAMVTPRWCQFQQFGSELICAHFLAMQQLNAQGGTLAGVPGLNQGIINSKSVSKVSVGRDVSATMIEGGGIWNYTTYGTQWLWFVQMVGTGGYETLGYAGGDIAGVALTWARGVLIGWLPW